MKIAIHHTKGTYSDFWIDYCRQQEIEFKVVSCYDNDILQQLEDCDALMWHHDHENAKDIQVARQLLYALGMSGKVVFPNFNTTWHFDDKVGQKYLLESIHAPMAPSFTFYSRKDALAWAKTTSFPKVFKLRGGAASSNVKLVRTKRQAIRLINKAFGRGFRRYHPWSSLKERWRLFRIGRADFYEVLKGLARFFRTTNYARVLGRDKGYIYFQEFIPDNTHDIRVSYVNKRCFASRRGVRPGDFRASGSYIPDMDQTKIPMEALRIAFDVAGRLGLQSAAFDFVLDKGRPLIVEISYAYGQYKEHYKHGYYDKDLNYHKEDFDAYHWMVDGVIEEIKKKSEQKN